jgi:hypothetical protein
VHAPGPPARAPHPRTPSQQHPPRHRGATHDYHTMYSVEAVTSPPLIPPMLSRLIVV